MSDLISRKVLLEEIQAVKVNKQEIQKTINHLTMLRKLDSGEKKGLYDTAISALEHSSEPTASEFLQKAKAICESKKGCKGCEMQEICGCPENYYDEADLVRKVMEYQIKEVSD